MKRKTSIRGKTSVLRRQRIPLIAAILAAVALIWYQFVPTETTAANPAPQGNAAAAGPSIVTLDGKTINVPQAGKPMAVYFFIADCPTCLPTLRRLAATSAKHPDVDYLPVSISPYDNASTVNGILLAANDENRAAALDPQARLAQALKASALGTLIVFDRRGSTVFRGIDPNADALAAAFTKAAQQ